MWRALFLSIGLTLILLGLQCLVVEQVVVNDIMSGSGTHSPTQQNFSPFQNVSFQPGGGTSPTANPRSKFRLFRTREWMPWSLLAAGSIVVIYTFSLPRRSMREEE